MPMWITSSWCGESRGLAARMQWATARERPAGGRARAMGSALGKLLRVGDGSERVAEWTGAGGVQAKPTTHYRAKTGTAGGQRKEKAGEGARSSEPLVPRVRVISERGWL
ncbi:hypothetical protein B0H12DRAFT_1073388 [Mycena haematopus]|nr:hypothetical protein B0H12DRAFT_1073388 [Mycena haematopus]